MSIGTGFRGTNTGEEREEMLQGINMEQ